MSVYPSALPSSTTTDFCIVSVVVLPFPKCHIVEIIQYIAFSGWLFTLSNMCLDSSMYFQGLLAHFFWSLNNIPLFECNAIYFHSSTEKLLRCFRVLEFINKAVINIMCRFLCVHTFSAPLGKYQGAWLLENMVKVCLVL